MCGSDEVAVNSDDDVADTKTRTRSCATMAHLRHAVVVGDLQPKPMYFEEKFNGKHPHCASVDKQGDALNRLNKLRQAHIGYGTQRMGERMGR